MTKFRTLQRDRLAIASFGQVATVFLVGLVLLSASASKAGLIVNELFRGNSASTSYIEFLVTSDITLSQLDGIWFGDSRGNTNNVHRENNFNATQIVSSVGSFNSTSDLLRAGTILTVGGSAISTDFNYNPDPSNPSDSDSWNITLTTGQGVDSSRARPFTLNRRGDVIWLGTSQPSSGSGSSDFISAVAYDNNPGNLAQQVDAQAQGGNDSFFLLTRSDFDGRLNNNNSISNTGGASISFGESNGGTFGEANNAANAAFTYDLRAVPEPSAIIPCLLILLCGIFFCVKRSSLQPAEA